MICKCMTLKPQTCKIDHMWIKSSRKPLQLVWWTSCNLHKFIKANAWKKHQCIFANTTVICNGHLWCGRKSLVTQPMLQRRPNHTELRSMDSYIQILCRFQKCKQKVPPPSLPPVKNKKIVFFRNKIFFPSSKQKLFFTCWKQFFFSERSKKKFKTFFLHLRVPGYFSLTFLEST